MEPLFTLSEVAERLGVSVYTLKERLREAGVHGPRPGREMRLTERDIAQLLENMRRRRRGGVQANPEAAKAELRKMRLRTTRRLGKRHAGPVVSLDLERPNQGKP